MSASSHQFETGIVSSRFQVLHNDHCKRLISGHRLCRYLVVAITEPEPGEIRGDPSKPQAQDRSASPLSYYERYVLVRDTLLNADVPPHMFSIVPLSLTRPQIFANTIPLDGVFLQVISGERSRRNYHYLESLGLSVAIMWEVPQDRKTIHAREVRRRMADNAPWEHLVPGHVAMRLREWGVPQRLRRLAAANDNP